MSFETCEGKAKKHNLESFLFLRREGITISQQTALISDFPKRLEKHTERYIEEELKLYPVFKEAVSELEREYIDILHRGRQFTIIPGASRDDKVSRAVIRMREIEAESADKLKRVERIERGLAILTSLERQYVKAAYFEFNEFTTYETIMHQLHIGNRNKLSRVKRDTLYKFAIVFNLV